MKIKNFDAVVQDIVNAEREKWEWCHFVVNEPDDKIRYGLIRLGKAYVADFKWLEIYEPLIGYIKDNQSKGLLLAGNCGTGKTLFATKIIPQIIRACFNRNVKVFNASEMNKCQDEVLAKKLLCIDDIGCEAYEKSYGTEIETIAPLMDSVEKEGKMLYLTTNLSGKELLERYGERAVERMKSTMKIVIFNAKSNRKSELLS